MNKEKAEKQKIMEYHKKKHLTIVYGFVLPGCVVLGGTVGRAGLGQVVLGGTVGRAGLGQIVVVRASSEPSVVFELAREKERLNGLIGFYLLLIVVNNMIFRFPCMYLPL